MTLSPNTTVEGQHRWGRVLRVIVMTQSPRSKAIVCRTIIGIAKLPWVSMTKEELDFLRESNNIEGETDDKALQDAILAWQYCKKQKILTSKIICKTHKLLMQSRNLEKKDKGAYRTQQVYIGGREGIRWEKILLVIDNWVFNVNDIVLHAKNESQIFLERRTKEHHVDYENIHPFIDGNGRTGRIFYNWERLKMGLPIHIIHTGKEQYSYYRWFN